MFERSLYDHAVSSDSGISAGDDYFGVLVTFDTIV